MGTSSRTATTTGTGSSNAATLGLPDGQHDLSVAWDTSGSASISVEVSDDEGTWYDRTHDVVSSQPSSSEKRAESFTSGFEFVRIYADQNVTKLIVSAKR